MNFSFLPAFPARILATPEAPLGTGRLPELAEGEEDRGLEGRPPLPPPPEIAGVAVTEVWDSDFVALVFFALVLALDLVPSVILPTFLPLLKIPGLTGRSAILSSVDYLLM
jgi:hypothetical protein